VGNERFYQAITKTEVENILSGLVWLARETELVDLNDAQNRVLADNIFAPINVPHFIKSRMDGYAVVARDTFEATETTPVTLNKIGEVPAGATFEGTVQESQCVKIATGAPLPEGADAVVMIENVEELENKVKIFQAVSPGQYVIKIGTDVKKGEKILSKRKILTVRDLGVLSAVGMTQVKVYNKPKIVIYSTGDEVLTPGEPLLPGKIYDINSTTLYHAIIRAGGQPIFKGILKDDPNSLKTVLKRELKESDFIIFSGGTSKGIGDYLPAIVKQLDDIIFLIHGIQIKPGKPTLICAVNVEENVKIIIILPGYPTSCLTIFNQFITPLINKAARLPKETKRTLEGETAKRIYSEQGRLEFKMVSVKEEAGMFKIYPIPTGSESITTLAKADGYIEIPELVSIVPKGEKVRVFLFE